MSFLDLFCIMAPCPLPLPYNCYSCLDVRSNRLMFSQIESREEEKNNNCSYSKNRVMPEVVVVQLQTVHSVALLKSLQ